MKPTLIPRSLTKCADLDKGTNRAQTVRGQNAEGIFLASCEVYLIS